MAHLEPTQDSHNSRHYQGGPLQCLVTDVVGKHENLFRGWLHERAQDFVLVVRRSECPLMIRVALFR